MAHTGVRHAFISRWYIALAGLLVTVMLCAVAAIKFPAKYQAKSVSLLLPAPTQTAANPYTNLSSLAGLTDVLSPLLSAPAITEQVQRAGNVGTYTVTKDVSSSGPIVLVTATSDTPDHATKLARYVTDLIPGRLRSLQSSLPDSVPSSAYITSRVINPVDKTTEVTKDRTRALVVAAVAGLLLAALSVLGYDRWAAGRPSRTRSGSTLRQRLSRVVAPTPATQVSPSEAVTEALPLRRSGESGTDMPIKAARFPRRNNRGPSGDDTDRTPEVVEAGR